MNKEAKRFDPGLIPKDDARFDALMTDWAKASSPLVVDAEPAPNAKLAWTLDGLGRLPAARRRPALPLRSAVVALALLALLSATALATTLGLARFNPTYFIRRPAGEEAGVAIEPKTMRVADASGLRLISVEAVDSAFVDGRLTLSVRVTSADESRPIFWGYDEDGLYKVQQGGDAGTHEPYERLNALPEGALLLEDMDSGWPYVLYPDGTRRRSPELSNMVVVQEGGLLMAIQAGATFITQDDLTQLVDADGRIPIELSFDILNGEEYVYETVIVSVAAPTDEEKEAMDP